MKRSLMYLTPVLAGVLGCSGAVSDTTEATSEAESAPLVGQARARANVQRTFMTRNVFLGATLDPVMAAGSLEEVPGLVAAAWAQLEANDFPARARSLANEIAANKPDLVGLQELALFRRFPQSGDPIEIDYLSLLQSALAARGLHYTTAVVQSNTDVTVPMFAGFDENGAPILDGVQVVDREAVLVRSDVRFTQPRSGRYAVGLPVPMPGASLEIVRGWASVVVDTDQGRFRFMSTHLDDYVPDVQVAQGAELLAMLQGETLPIVLVGDFNSRPDGTGTATYGMIKDAGFVDLWAQAHPRDAGYTCCRPENLWESGPLYERVDLVFTTPSRACGTHRIRGPVQASLVGDRPRDRTASGLWPSDHAGVVASFVVPFAGTH